MTDQVPVPLSDDDLVALHARLERLDRGGKSWAKATLRLIEKYPGVNSTALARQAGVDRADFKGNLRTLRDLGVTEGIGTGYRLSPVGLALLRSMG
jgi:hypothetical protein